MKIFVTGASGHIGSYVTKELIETGHQVLGLARSDESEQRLKNMGAESIRGSLNDLNIIKEAAKSSDGVIHLAFRHDIAFSGKMDEAIAIDLKVLKAIAQGLEGSNKPLVGTSGTLMLSFAGLGRTGLESDVLDMPGRVANENFVIGLAEKNIRSSVIRLAPTVHGPHDGVGGFIPTLIKIAHEKGVSAYIGEGDNVWPAVHEIDAAHLYRLAVESAPAGTRLHGVADEAVEFRSIAKTIADKLDVPTKSINPEEAESHFAPLGMFAGLSNPTSSKATQLLLNWHPAHPGLIEDLQSGNYFDAY